MSRLPWRRKREGAGDGTARAVDSVPAVTSATPRVGGASGRLNRVGRILLGRPARPEPHGVDVVLAAAVVAIVGFGVVMVYSASSFEATVKFHDAQHFVKRQGIYAAVALVLMWAVSHFDYHRLRKLTYPMLIGVVGMLLATVVGLGHRAGNAYRWLAVGPIHIQPSETAKVALVFWLAYSLSKKGERVRSFTVGVVPHMLVVGGLMALCLKQPDFGSAVVLLTLTFIMMFIAGVRLPYLASLLATFGLAAAALVRFSGYRYARYLSWLDLENHRQGLAYQPFQSVMSFGSGGLLGLGLGRGLQVLYLPEAHTDFIAAIIGEELGFVGLVAMCGVYLLIVARGVRIALEATDDYGSYIAFGLSAMIAIQVVTNLAVAMAILPTKGLTLPFVSYGGSSLLVSACAVGVLLNISRCKPEVIRASAAPDGASVPSSRRATGAAGPTSHGPEPSATAVVVTAAEEGTG